MTVGKYWDELKGAYGAYATNTTAESPIPFTSAPPKSDWDIIKLWPHAKYIQVRFSWRSLERTEQGVYNWSQVDQLMEDADRYEKFFRIELMWVNPQAGAMSGSFADQIKKSPVPEYMFEDRFNIDPSEATGEYGGGCYGFLKTGRYKLWPRMWVEPVYTGFANMCRALLLHIKEDERGAKWFQGLQLTETNLQDADKICIGNSIGALNWDSQKLFDGYTHITDTIHETWPEPLHSIYANHGYGIASANGVLTHDHWRAWLGKACGEQAFGYGTPDTWNLHHGVTANSTCDEDSRQTTKDSRIGKWAYEAFQKKGIIIQSTQNSGCDCFGEGAARHPKKLLNYARGALNDSNGRSPRANLFVCALVKNRDPKIATSWSVYDLMDAVATGDYPLKTDEDKVDPIFHSVERGGGGGTDLAAPSNLRVENGLLLWDYTTVEALKGFRVWVSATQAGEPLTGTKRFNTGTPDARSVSLASLVPPATGHWLCVRARGAGVQSPIASLQIAAVTTLAAPTQVCVNFGDETISWVYADATGNPALGFHVYVDDVLVKIAGPDRRAIPRLRSTWTNATEYDVKVEAVGALGTTSLTRTFTYANETTGSSCTA